MNKLFTYLASVLHMSSEEDKNRFFRTILPTFIIQIGGVILSVCVSLMMGRIMGASSFGIYVYCFSIVTGIVNLMVYGLNILALRETSSLLAVQNIKLWKGFVSWNIYYLLLVSMVGTIAAAVVFYFTSVLPESAYRVPMLIASVSIPGYAFLLMFSSVLRGMHKVLLSQVAEKIIRPVVLLFLLVVIYLFEKNISLYTAILLNSLAFFAAMAFIILKYIKSSRPILHSIRQEYESKRWVKEVAALFLFGVLISIEAQIDIYMLGYLRSPAEVGIYKVASTIATFTAFFLGVSNVVLAPSFARFHALQERDKLQHLVTQTIRWVMLLTAPVAIIIIIFSRWILSLWGAEFTAGQLALIILCVSHLVNSAFGSVGNLALMSKFEKYNALAIILSIVINIVLNLILTPKWGINGTAFSYGLSIIAWNTLLFAVVKNKTGIKTWAFSSGRKN